MGIIHRDHVGLGRKNCWKTPSFSHADSSVKANNPSCRSGIKYKT